MHQQVTSVSQARVAELEEAAVAAEVRVEEAEGQLAAAQAELETVVGERDGKIQQLSEEHADALAVLETSYKAEVCCLSPSAFSGEKWGSVCTHQQGGFTQKEGGEWYGFGFIARIPS